VTEPHDKAELKDIERSHSGKLARHASNLARRGLEDLSQLDGRRRTQSLINYCRENGRICPLEKKWNELYQILPNKRRVGLSWEPPVPLILGAWYYTDDSAKMDVLAKHIEWAEKHGCLDAAASYLRNLQEEDWHHKERPRVLVVDDESAIVGMLERILTSNGYDVHSTCSALEAIRLGREFVPRVALLGLVMPQMDGIALGRELANTYLLAHTTRVVLSNESFDLDLEELRNCGYQFDKLPFPFETEQLLEQMKSWVDVTTAFDLITGFGLTPRCKSMLEREMNSSEQSGGGFSIVYFRQSWNRRSPLLDDEAVDQSWDRSPYVEAERNLLAKFSKCMESLCRPTDYKFQFWERTWEHFEGAVFLPMTSRVFAEQFAGKLREMISATDWSQLAGASGDVALDSLYTTSLSFPENPREAIFSELGLTEPSPEDINFDLSIPF
jgi:CheY-like chemotaxis protein